MNRTKWEFSTPANEILAAVAIKHAHHSARLSWWTTKREETIAKIKSEGLEIDDSLAAGLRAGTASNDVNTLSYGRGPTVQIRTDLMRDLRETLEKIDQHRNTLHEYETWRQLLSTQGSTALALNSDDWWYFFGKPIVSNTEENA